MDGVIVTVHRSDVSVRFMPPLPEVYEKEGLPLTRSFDELSVGEKRAIKEMGLTEHVRKMETVQVLAARTIQGERFARSRIRYNADMSHRQVVQHCKLNDQGHNILRTAMEDFGLSARAHDKILRIARTIADLENSPTIAPMHLFEAITYRTLDRKLWV